MTTTAKHQTEVSAPADLPTIRIVREFDAPPESVYRAWTDPTLFARWIGPNDITTRIDHWDARTGGSWRYTALRGDQVVASFYGSFHELRPDTRMVQTFTFDGAPDEVSLEKLVLEALPGGRTRVTILAVVDSITTRNMILASGMEIGVREGYEKLDELLAR
jgi:uncharacterized protein YndB with AHSA1/START domain